MLVNHLCGALLALAAIVLPSSVKAEDGYDLWLRFAPLTEAQADAARPYIGRGAHLLAERTPTIDAALQELGRAAEGMTGSEASPHPRLTLALAGRLYPGWDSSAADLRGAGSGAFSIRLQEGGRLVIAANDDLGLLYGTFALLRHLQETGSLAGVEQSSSPAMPLRMLNHWDNPDGYVERGYSGRSIFDWWHLPDHLDQRMVDYARANASIGINAVAVNNVNASAEMLEPRYIARLARLADAWRPYGIRVYLSARFSAPRDIGGLDNADPLNPAVRAWWAAKADEIYAAIPDFGGFLVKANSEGQPGPQDYGRTHADGANMLAEALGDRGTVIWRAFVYSAEDDTDRAAQAFAEFVPLDGQFASNVIVQVKNGPIDFQPREPFHPMFGAMPHTRLMLEAQITKEYLGFATHLAYLAPMWEEVLDADTGRGATVAEVIAPVGMAGVANTGSDRNWSGSHFDQANWYAFGRLAWDPSLGSAQIAREWIAQTFTRDVDAKLLIGGMMMESRQAVVDTMTPLGLAHLMGTGHHYGPAPWVCDLARPEWNPCYYHRADAGGIGFDRTAAGSSQLAQYAPEVAAQWDDPDTVPDDYLLWFHHVGWDHDMRSGRSLWAELVHRYDTGVAQVDRMAEQWQAAESHIDAQRFGDVRDHLAIQRREARWWRDASLAYWQSLNGLPLPEGTRPPAHSLEHYQSLSFPEAPGN